MKAPPATTAAHVRRALPRAAENRRGILYMAAGMSCLVLNDTLMKFLGQSHGVDQLICVRGLIAITMILAVARGIGATAALSTLRNRQIAVRVVLDSLGTVLYLGSLMNLPIGNATAINLAAPLIMALFAFLFMGEHPGARRWLAIGAGFVGVILVIQPRVEGFNAWALACLAATVFQSTRDLQTRRIPAHVPAILIALASVSFVTALATASTLARGWQPMAPTEFGLLAAAAALLAAGYHLLVNSMRHGEISIVAPFRYCGLLVALLAGFAVWDEIPSAPAWGGIALLLAAGVYLLHDERRRRDEELPLA
jgi:drug/metabolite transporter (DMT)-like permease